jgi:hypothetical protein
MHIDHVTQGPELIRGGNKCPSHLHLHSSPAHFFSPRPYTLIFSLILGVLALSVLLWDDCRPIIPAVGLTLKALPSKSAPASFTLRDFRPFLHSNLLLYRLTSLIIVI